MPLHVMVRLEVGHLNEGGPMSNSSVHRSCQVRPSVMGGRGTLEK
jgi:hypothetical protein